MLRLVQYFRPIPAAAAARRCWHGRVLGALLPTPLPPVRLALIAYFVAIDGYAMIAFVRSALTTSGVVRQKLRLAAAGSGLLALALLITGVGALFPRLREAIALLTQFVAILSALAYYVGFAPPRWLRRSWQLAELHDFLQTSAALPALQRTSASLDRLCLSASRAVGARASAVALGRRSEAADDTGV
jgi:hypothetical protein